MAWNEPYVHTETITVTSAQKVITAPRRYQPGLGDLIVYLNGLYAVRDKDYIELTPYSIEFIEEVDEDDTIVFHYQKMW